MKKYTFEFTWWQDKKQLSSTRKVEETQALAKFDSATAWIKENPQAGRNCVFWGPGVMRTTLNAESRARLVDHLTSHREMIGVVWMAANEIGPADFRLFKLFRSLGGIYQFEVVPEGNNQKAWYWLNRECPWSPVGGWINDRPALVWTGAEFSEVAKCCIPIGIIIENGSIRYDRTEGKPEYIDYPHIRSTRTARALKGLRSRWAVPGGLELSYMPAKVIEGYGRKLSYGEMLAKSRA